MAEKDKWVWCMDCKRAFKASESRVFEMVDPDLGFIGIIKCCPYDGCEGLLGTECEDYQKSKKHLGSASWPDTPEKDVIYPHRWDD